MTLDELALRYPRVDIVKIDAEGGEVGIVAGMQRLIARDRPTIVLEFNAARYSRPAGVSRHAVAGLLDLPGALPRRLAQTNGHQFNSKSS